MFWIFWEFLDLFWGGRTTGFLSEIDCADLGYFGCFDDWRFLGLVELRSSLLVSVSRDPSQVCVASDGSDAGACMCRCAAHNPAYAPPYSSSS